MAKVKLINVGNQIDADMLLNLLENEGIWAEKRSKGSGGYMQIAMNTNFYGFDIYVEDVDFDSASEIAKPFFPKEKHEVIEKEHSFFSLLYNPKMIIVYAVIIVLIMLIKYSLQ